MSPLVHLIRSETSKLHVYFGTLVGTTVCIAAALFADSFNFPEMSPAYFHRAVATDILLPLIIGGPFFYFLLEKIRQLAVARLELQHIATTDSLTAVLNRGAFVMLVEAYLDKATATGSPTNEGCLLIVDADHFKAINDVHGHQTGDQALKLIAGTIKKLLSGAELVGRVGGEEFAVFLPNAERSKAVDMAERIREKIRNLPFPEGTTENMLSVSIGGVAFSEPSTYKELFRVADLKLYEAKSSGRNLVRI